MYDRILVPTDGRPATESAVTRALSLAESVGAAVDALAVVDTSHAAAIAENREDWLDAADTAGREAVAWIRDRADDRGLETASQVREGEPHREILAYADERAVDLVVMATRASAGGDWPRVGSVTERVVTAGDVPVLAIPPGADADGALDLAEVVLPTDGSDVAEAATTHGLDLAAHAGARAHAVYVVDRSMTDYGDAPGSVVGMLKTAGRSAVDAVAADAQDRDVAVQTHVLRGAPDSAILQYTEGVDADLIVLGTRGAAAGSDRLLGSTTARVLRRSRKPVLVT